MMKESIQQQIDRLCASMDTFKAWLGVVGEKFFHPALVVMMAL
jgi:hypothetical protein